MSGLVEFECETEHKNWRGETPCPFCMQKEIERLREEVNRQVQTLAACASLARNGEASEHYNKTSNVSSPALFSIRKLVEEKHGLRSAMERYRQEREDSLKDFREYRRLLRGWLDPQANYADLDKLQKESEALLEKRSNFMKLVTHDEE